MRRSQKSDESRNNKIKDDSESSSERRMVVNQSAHRKIPENLKLNSGVSDLTPPQTSSTSGPYIAISDCISGNPLIDRDNPTTPLNSLDPKFYDTPRSHFNIGLNLTNEQPYSPKRNNILSVNIYEIKKKEKKSMMKFRKITDSATDTTKWQIDTN